MHIVFHIGAHCTSQDRLVRSLLRNRDVLSKNGVAVPGPGKYRKLITDAIGLLRGAPASREGEDVLLEQILDSDSVDRLILCSDGFICSPLNVLEYGTLYPRIGKSAWLRNAFPTAKVSFALSIRNMATFLPAIYVQLAQRAPDPHDFLAQTDPRTLAWFDVIEAITDANPGTDILVWCDEDAPFLWPEIMREICDLDPLVPLQGGNDMARQILSVEGNKELALAIETTVPESESERRRILAEILMDYADEAEVIQEIELPGWTDALVDDLSDLYDLDVERIKRLPGVRLLEP